MAGTRKARSEVGTYKLDLEAIAEYIAPRLRKSKTFRRITEKWDLTIVDAHLSPARSSARVELVIIFEALKHKWITYAGLKVDPDGTVSLGKMSGDVHCMEKYYCAADSDRGTFGGLEVGLQKADSIFKVVSDPGYHYKPWPIISEVDGTGEVEMSPFDCNECKHKLVCLTDARADVTFERI